METRKFYKDQHLWTPLLKKNTAPISFTHADGLCSAIASLLGPWERQKRRKRSLIEGPLLQMIYQAFISMHSPRKSNWWYWALFQGVSNTHIHYYKYFHRSLCFFFLNKKFGILSLIPMWLYNLGDLCKFLFVSKACRSLSLEVLANNIPPFVTEYWERKRWNGWDQEQCHRPLLTRVPSNFLRRVCSKASWRPSPLMRSLGSWFRPFLVGCPSLGCGKNRPCRPLLLEEPAEFGCQDGLTDQSVQYLRESKNCK